MAFRIEGLAPQEFAPLFDLPDEALAGRRARRVVADSDGYPCRVTLEDAAPGEELVLVNHVSHDIEGPFRTSHAIYVRRLAKEIARFADEIPPILDRRIVSLRGYDHEGMLRDGTIAQPGEADRKVRALLANPAIAAIHAHTATYGCFLARIERD